MYKWRNYPTSLLTSRLWISGTVILTGSVRFLGLGRLENKPPLDGSGSRSSFDELLAAAGVAFGSLLGPWKFPPADPGFFGAGSVEKSRPAVALLSGVAEVEVSSESLSSLLP